MGIIAFAFGDALLYVILPVHADAFGVSMLMVGFLLAVNRIIRTFAYGFIADLAERIGLKKCVSLPLQVPLYQPLVMDFLRVKFC